MCSQTRRRTRMTTEPPEPHYVCIVRGNAQRSNGLFVPQLRGQDDIVACGQDLAVVGLMEVWRNFFLGSELTAGKYPLAPMKIKEMREIADTELKKMGITVKDINQPIGTL